MVVSDPTILNLALASTAVEYPLDLPDNIARLRIQVATSDNVRMAFREGDTADGKDYWTLKGAQRPYVEDQPITGKHTLYFRPASNTLTVQVMYWR